MTSTPITREELERLTMDCLVIVRNTEGVGRSDMIKLLPTHKDLLAFIDRYTNAKVLEAENRVYGRLLELVRNGTIEMISISLDGLESQLKKEQE